MTYEPKRMPRGCWAIAATLAAAAACGGKGASPQGPAGGDGPEASTPTPTPTPGDAGAGTGAETGSGPDLDAGGVPDAVVDYDGWTPAPWTPKSDAKPSAACGASVTPPADGYQDIMSNGEARRFVIHLPAGYDGTKTFPAIFVYHSLGEDALQFEKSKFDFPALARETAVLVEMEALLVNNQRSFERDPPDDLVYTDTVVAWLESNVCFDTSRMYATGQSVGATFVEILGCQRTDVFRAIAANVPHSTDVSACKGPIPSWFSYGTQQSSFLVQEQETMLAYWIKVDGCDTANPQPTAFPPCQAYACKPGYPVQSCAYAGQHPWPDFASPAVFQFFLGF
jgi:poly(3-hydroxybutyrate) depolymerase